MRVSDSTFGSGVIELDNNEFHRCVFENVTLVYAAVGPTTLANCTFNNVQWQFQGPATLALTFLTSLYHNGGKAVVEHVFESVRRPPAPPGIVHGDIHGDVGR